MGMGKNWGLTLIVGLFPLVSLGAEIPDVIELTALKGKSTHQLKVHEKGEVRVLFFWASWCGFCQEFGSVLESYAKRPGVKIYSLGVDDEKDKSYAANLAKYRNLKNAAWISPEVKKKMGLKTIPLVVLIDKDGRIDTVYEGSQADKLNYFAKRLRTLLGDGTVEE